MDREGGVDFIINPDMLFNIGRAFFPMILMEIRQQFVDAFPEVGQQFPGAQNVHDTYVNCCIRHIISVLRKDQRGLHLPTLNAIRAEVLSKFSTQPPQRLRRALRTFSTTMKAEFCPTLDITDAEMLIRVWARSYDFRNSKVRRQIQEAIFDALDDCWEINENNIMLPREHLVCVHGRIGRYAASLTNLDFDKSTWRILQTEQLHEEVAYIAYYFHWPLQDILEMEHSDRRKWVEQIAGINRKLAESG